MDSEFQGFEQIHFTIDSQSESMLKFSPSFQSCIFKKGNTKHSKGGEGKRRKKDEESEGNSKRRKKLTTKRGKKEWEEWHTFKENVEEQPLFYCDG